MKIDILILSIIEKQDIYGYEIAKCIREKSEDLYYEIKYHVILLKNEYLNNEKTR
ncbi:hypothetical protein [Clostridium sp. BJN0013]|uniref:hypothetical protein n=1 Tax=Clostridium sp. BJN0013 TaxID=3236840 RepID=UPI0034C699A0